MHRTIFITGGFGFVGINLVTKLLSDKINNLFILSRSTPKNLPEHIQQAIHEKRIHVVKGSIHDNEVIENAVQKCQYVIHLAGITTNVNSYAESIPLLETNVIGTVQLLAAIEKYPIKQLIVLSSTAVYGNRTNGAILDEESPLNPINVYGVSKLAADRLASAFHYQTQIPVMILRPFNIYGPYQKPDKMIPIFITRLLKNEPIMLNHGGKQTRDWIHVKDVVNAIEKVLQQSDSTGLQIFNLSSGIGTSVVDIAQKILKALHKDSSFVHINTDAAIEAMDSIGSYKKIEQALGWQPTYTIEEGIKQTVEWYKIHY